MSNGIFSQSIYHHEIFDTGDPSNQPQQQEPETHRERLLKEDEEIMLFIAAIESSE